MYNGASTETPAQRAARDAKEKAKTDRWKHFSAALTKAVYKAFDTQSSQLAKPVFARLCKALQLPASTTAAQLPKALLRSEIDTLFRHLGSWEEDAAVEWAKVLGVDVKACEPKAEAAGKPKSAKKAKKGRAA